MGRDHVPGGVSEGAAVLSGTVNTTGVWVQPVSVRGSPRCRAVSLLARFYRKAADMAQNTMGKQMLTHRLVYSSQVSWLLLASPRDQKGHFSLVGVLEFKLFL